jgi:hypothetical protein
MRTIQPEPGYTEADVKAVIASRQFVFTDCITMTAPNNDSIRCCSTEKDVIVTPIGGGVKQTWTSKGIKITGIKTVVQAGVDVDEQEAQLDFTPDNLFQGLPIPTALLWGRFDGGTLTRDRYFAASFGIGNEPTLWMGGTRMYAGTIADLDEVGRSYAKFKTRSQIGLLNINVPNGLIGAGSTNNKILWNLAAANMALGTVYIETISGVTLVRTIREVNPGVSLTLAYPLEVTPSTGQNFAVYEGCDRSYTRCGVLGNQVNFRGYPFVPTEDTAL